VDLDGANLNSSRHRKKTEFLWNLKEGFLYSYFSYKRKSNKTNVISRCSRGGACYPKNIRETFGGTTTGRGVQVSHATRANTLNKLIPPVLKAMKNAQVLPAASAEL